MIGVFSSNKQLHFVPLAITFGNITEKWSSGLQNNQSLSNNILFASILKLRNSESLISSDAKGETLSPALKP